MPKEMMNMKLTFFLEGDPVEHSLTLSESQQNAIEAILGLELINDKKVLRYKDEDVEHLTYLVKHAYRD